MFKKIIALLLLVSLFLLASCANAGTPDKQNSNTSKEDISSPVSNTESNISEDNSQEDSEDDNKIENIIAVPKGYMGLVNKLQKLVNARLSPAFESYWNGGHSKDFELSDKFLGNPKREIEGDWSNMLIEMDSSYSNPSVEKFGYALSDLNKDGIDELLFMSEDGFIHAMFTLCDNQPVLLDAFWSRYSCVILENGDIFARGSGGAEILEGTVRSLDKETCDFKTLIKYNYDGWENVYTIETDGKEETVDKETIDARLEQYPVDFEKTNKEYLEKNKIKFVNFVSIADEIYPILFFDGTEGDGKAFVLYTFDEHYMYLTRLYKYNGSKLEDFVDSELTKVETNIIDKDKTLKFFTPDGKSFETAIGDIYCVGEPILDTAHVKTELKNFENSNERYIGSYSDIDIFPDDIEVKEDSITVDIDGDGKKDLITWEFTPADAKEYGEGYYFYSVEIKIGEKTLTVGESAYLPFLKEDVELFVFDADNDGYYDLGIYNKAHERFDWFAIFDLTGDEAFLALMYEITPQN